jgi:hypothetical protein
MLTSRAQVMPASTKIDDKLSLVFPANATRIDTLGNILVQTTLGKITYQLVKKNDVLDKAGKAEWEKAIQAASEQFAGMARFQSFAKQIRDTVIGGAEGDFIRMIGLDHGIRSRIFIFLTIRQRDIYSIQMTSFNDESTTRKMMQWFYSHVVFSGKPY